MSDKLKRALDWVGDAGPEEEPGVPRASIIVGGAFEGIEQPDAPYTPPTPEQQRAINRIVNLGPLTTVDLTAWPEPLSRHTEAISDSDI